MDDLTANERVALDYCGPLGIPISVFLGRVVYPGDPQWTERDRWAALWWRANVCRQCGELLSETMADFDEDNPRREFEWQAAGKWCHGCRAIHREELAMAGKNPHQDADPTVGARFWIVGKPAGVA